MIPQEILDEIKWKIISPPLGGQHTNGGHIGSDVYLISEEFNFSIKANSSPFRSINKTKEFCLTIYELYLQESKYI